MYYILLLIFLFLTIAFIVTQKKVSTPSESAETSYQLIDSVFTPAERSFYGVLKQCVDGETEILAKVRVADVLKPQRDVGKGAWQAAFNKISRKHFDFLLCRKSDLSVICGIELNDKSHKNKERRGRDNFLQLVCTSAKLPLVMINAQASYNISEIKQTLSVHIPALSVSLITKAVDPAITVQGNPEQPKEDPIQDENKVCPKCSTELVKRIAKKGAHAGKSFWACGAYPKCRHIEQAVV